MKKLLHILKNIAVICLVLFAIGMMTFTIISVTTLDKTDRSLFGYKAFIVLTDSMSATDFAAGDLVIVKEVKPETLKIGDIISYRSTNLEHYYEVVTHKIRSSTIDPSGKPGFITYGTTTGTDDEEIVTYQNILGIHKMTIPKIGTFFQFLKSTPGYIVCILTPFLLLILIQAVHSITLFRKYKRETVEEIDEERKRIETERIENELIKRQLADSEEKTKKIEIELASLKKKLATSLKSDDAKNEKKEKFNSPKTSNDVSVSKSPKTSKAKTTTAKKTKTTVSTDDETPSKKSTRTKKTQSESTANSEITVKKTKKDTSVTSPKEQASTVKKVASSTKEKVATKTATKTSKKENASSKTTATSTKATTKKVSSKDTKTQIPSKKSSNQKITSTEKDKSKSGISKTVKPPKEDKDKLKVSSSAKKTAKPARKKTKGVTEK